MSTGNALRDGQDKAVAGAYVELLGGRYYRIANYDQLPPFFMSITSSSDHWLFLSSTGGLSAGRVDADNALFPYYTDDKISENADNTGPKTLLRASSAGRVSSWEPFSGPAGESRPVSRNLYKSPLGDSVIFEEINHDLALTFRYAWRSSDRFGLVRTAWLENRGTESATVELLDGLQNLLPYGANSGLTASMSNLLDAYKRAELDAQSGLAIFALNAALSDLAEASESLMASTVWQVGLPSPTYLLSAEQVPRFRRGERLESEREVRGRRGAYLVGSTLSLQPGETRSWSIAADVNQDLPAVEATIALLGQGPTAVATALEADIARTSAELQAIVARADGLQLSGDEDAAKRHLANVLFNVMRGGIFADGYDIEAADLRAFIGSRNRNVLAEHAAFFASLPERLAVGDLLKKARESGSADVERLCTSYLPLTFSRRHGDPSRPWNRFAIRLKHPDGSRRLDYQGNWRDIFQNWEALCYSYPEFLDGTIATFLNATTADGYNPYRVTRDGIDWEAPERHNPWANIGYWSDHQVIYLLKLLEASERFHPGRLAGWLERPVFSNAAVPYRLKSYEEMLADPGRTIEFDWEADAAAKASASEVGSDGRLVRDEKGHVIHVSLNEKLLSIVLAKLVNLVPEGGIWMNTQRPEWNDANNALVGKGLSVVTAAYLLRFVRFWRDLLAAKGESALGVGPEQRACAAAVTATLRRHASALRAGLSDGERRQVMDALGRAGSEYRARLYAGRPGVAREEMPVGDLASLLDLADQYLAATLRANRREDGLYHGYNTLRLGEGTAAIARLDEMLEGQVAILSSGLLAPGETLDLLRALRASRLYRADQHSYLLYPNRAVKSFLEKNRLRASDLEASRLAAALEAAGDRSLLARSPSGDYHFNGSFHNARDVQRALDLLGRDERFGALVAAERQFVLDLFERTFEHASFTGRSGTFFAYEGLGSIYWHMVAKLLLAVQEVIERTAAGDPALPGLKAAYYDIRQGLSFNKTPAEYGAFPADPYSHTPAHRGAQQPGMTGQVKEEVLTRLAEVGLRVRDGRLNLDPGLLRERELLASGGTFRYLGLDGAWHEIEVPAGSLAFTYCQVPFLCQKGDKAAVEIIGSDGTVERVAGLALGLAPSEAIFQRDGSVARVHVTYPTLLPD